MQCRLRSQEDVAIQVGAVVLHLHVGVSDD